MHAIKAIVPFAYVATIQQTAKHKNTKILISDDIEIELRVATKSEVSVAFRIETEEPTTSISDSELHNEYLAFNGKVWGTQKTVTPLKLLDISSMNEDGIIVMEPRAISLHNKYSHNEHLYLLNTKNPSREQVNPYKWISDDRELAVQQVKELFAGVIYVDGYMYVEEKELCYGVDTVMTSTGVRLMILSLNALKFLGYSDAYIFRADQKDEAEQFAKITAKNLGQRYSENSMSINVLMPELMTKTKNEIVGIDLSNFKEGFAALYKVYAIGVEQAIKLTTQAKAEWAERRDEVASKSNSLFFACQNLSHFANQNDFAEINQLELGLKLHDFAMNHKMSLKEELN